MILNYHCYRQFLRDELSRRTRANPRYSLRAFSKNLGINPAELSSLLREKRNLSLKSAKKISLALELNQNETLHLLQLCTQTEATAQTSNSGTASRQLTTDLFNIVSDWYCFAILNLSEIEGFQWSPQWIAHQLEITRIEVQSALERLERVGLIQKKGRGYQTVEGPVLSTKDIPSEAIRNFHRTMLQRASHAIDTQSLKERDFQGVGIAIDPKSIPEIKSDIQAFIQNLIRKHSKGKKKSVYHLEISFFRQSRG